MNAVEIEEAISKLAEKEFSPENFPFEFLESFGDKPAIIKRLRAGSTNKSDLKDQGGVLKRSNIHLLVCEEGAVGISLESLKKSPSTTKAKANFILATDGLYLEAEDLNSGETVACDFKDFPNHFGFFLPLAGISTVKQIRNNPIDIQATGRLNRLYVELLKENEDWDTDERRQDMNHFMARLIFCFFAEDTSIFNGENLFTNTIEQMSGSRDNNADMVISEIFRAMDIPVKQRKKANLRSWADQFPYVNGGLFTEDSDVPKFNRIARSYLLHAGNLDWTAINPDIFGSMIQAVADEDERGSLGMHYTSVPNILKVLNPLFLDELKQSMDDAKDNPRKLFNLKKRISRIRVFDPACGSGNFLVIAYKYMREIEFEINQQRNETHLKSEIPLTNFRGIEIKHFSSEIARLALIIAEYQCDVIYRGQKDALAEFLPLDTLNWITCDNALRVDWLSVCPPTGKAVKQTGDDLFSAADATVNVDFENEGGETYICGNPPYLGSTWQSKQQKEDLKSIFDKRIKNWKSLDYVSGWFIKAVDYGNHTQTKAAFVSTNSVCQGQMVPILWPLIFENNYKIEFAYPSLKWSNLASNKAGVTVAIIGITNQNIQTAALYVSGASNKELVKKVPNINAYLVPSNNTIVLKSSKPIFHNSRMDYGNKPTDGGNLLFSASELKELNLSEEEEKLFIHKIYGSAEFIRGLTRYCLWIEDANLDRAKNNAAINLRINSVKDMRLGSSKKSTREGAKKSHKFDEIRQKGDERIIVIPKVSSENREYLPVGLLPEGSIISDRNFGIYEPDFWSLAIIASRLHLNWIGTICGRLRTDYMYSNTLGWNTFPVPTLTEKNKIDLTCCAKDILLAREAHFPATIADLYHPDDMPDDLRHAHERNDEVIERIYIGRKFKNDTERLEKLFEMYTQMIDKETKAS